MAPRGALFINTLMSAEADAVCGAAYGTSRARLPQAASGGPAGVHQDSAVSQQLEPSVVTLRKIDGPPPRPRIWSTHRHWVHSGGPGL